MVFLASCVTYENRRVTGSAARDVTRADIAEALAAVRADPHVRRGSDELRAIEVISHDEILLYWTSKEIDTMKRIRGKWERVVTAITVG